MNKKTIIFIGGTSRSGSTLLDLILGNNEKAISLGEILSIVHPTKEKHFVIRNKLLNDKVWGMILQEKKSKLYDNIFKAFPDKEIFIDSSKDPLWINYFNRKMKKKCDVKNVLIYKQPEELAVSFLKRGYKNKWIRAYRHYHKKYNTLIDDYFSIYLYDLIKSDDVLMNLCKKLDVPYHENIRSYHEKNSTMFYGSETPNKLKGIDNKHNDIKYTIPENILYIFKEVVELLETKSLKSEINQHQITTYKYNDVFIYALKIKTRLFYYYNIIKFFRYYSFFARRHPLK